MLSELEINEIKVHLEKAQNPLFLFDNDVDGLCSFLLLRKFIGRGKGVAIKSYPELDASYVKKIDEFNADYVFVLDKPVVSDSFRKEVKAKNIPFVWIDHHNLNPGDLEGINYYNSFNNGKGEPVTYVCWEITKRKEDLWLALAGCIADAYLPEFSSEVGEVYPELWKHVKSAFEGVYKTQIGKVTQIMSFGLKDRTSNVVKMMKFLLKAKPHDILEENIKNPTLKRFNQINGKYQRLLSKAESFIGSKKLVYFQYGGDLSISGDLANELIYKYPEKIIVVVYMNGTKATLSLRGKGVRKLTVEAIKEIDGATGEGHEEATGAKMNIEDLPKFKDNLERLIGK